MATDSNKTLAALRKLRDGVAQGTIDRESDELSELLKDIPTGEVPPRGTFKPVHGDVHELVRLAEFDADQFLNVQFACQAWIMHLEQD